MKKILIGLFALSSLSAFASDNCKIAVEGGLEPLTLEHKQILKNYLKSKYTEIEDEADYKLIVNASSETVFDSMWTARGFLGSMKGGNKAHVVMGTDKIVSLPIHFATLGLGTMVSTKGNVAVGRMANKIPSCDKLNELLN